MITGRRNACLYGAIAVAGVFGCLDAAITPQIGASRVSGVAPLAVFVDATMTAGLDGGDYVNADFDWNFDRDGVDLTGKHTVTRGFVAAHVYENPGTYTIQLTVHDRLGTSATSTQQVVVSTFSGTTYYVASDGSNSAAGTSMSAPLATLDYAISQKAASNTQILLRRGDRFAVPTMSTSGKPGPVTIGAYTDPNHPSTDAPILVASGGWVTISSSDWRFEDLHLLDCGASFSNGSTNNLLLRVELTGATAVFQGSSSVGAFVFDCWFHDFRTSGLYCEGVNQTALVGNLERRISGNQHFFRCQGGSKAFVAYNDLDQSGVNYDNITIRGNTSQVYVLGNRLDQMLSFRPQNGAAVEHQSYCVADGNVLTNGDILVHANHIAVRNNIVTGIYGGVNLDTGGLVPASDSVTILNNSCYGTGLTELVAGAGTNIVIKNNIFYTTTNLGYATGLFLENALSNYQIDNNIYYAPNKGGPLWFTIQGVNQVKTGFTDWQATGADVHGRYADPLFVSTDSSSPDFLKLSANSPARGAGAGVPVFCDFAGAVRPAGQPTDAGAWLYGSSSVRPSLPLVKWYPDRAIPASGAFDLRGRAVQMKERRSMCGAAGILILRPALSVSQASATPVISYGLVTSK